MKKEMKEKIDKIEYLEETIQSMEASLNNLIKVRSEQINLINIVENSDQKDSFKKFIDETRKQVEMMSDQYSKLVKRKEELKKVIDKCKKDPKINEIINSFMNAVGMFE